jgi:two-component system sensor histidine kinase AtoS
LKAGVLFVNRFGEVTLANDAASRLLGISMKELLVTPIEELLAPVPELIKFLPADAGRAEFRRILSDGKEVVFGASISKCTTLFHGEERWHLTVLFQDITRWKQLREENDRLLQMSTVSELMPTMLHELKNPLASIAMSVELLMEESKGGLREELQAVLSEVQRMELTLQGVGLAGRELRTHRLAEVEQPMRHALLILSRQAGSRGVTLVNELELLPPLALHSSVIRAVLFNLVTNAIQACRPGDVITFRAGVTEDTDSFWMEVEDTGVGMDEETLERCRALFYTTKPRGSGIGLALCNKVSLEAEGSLEIHSKEGEGTLVRFVVPLE